MKKITFEQIKQETQNFTKLTTIGPVEITPELATTLLLVLNQRNYREIKDAKVKEYVDLMNNGLWRYSGQNTIDIGKEGILYNAQHRLTAISKSKKSQIFNIVTGVEKDAIDTYDCGYARTISQMLSHKGYKNTPILSTVLRQLLSHFSGKLSSYIGTSGEKYSPVEIAKFVEKLGDEEMNKICSAITESSTFSKKNRWANKTHIAFFKYLYSKYENEDKVNDFFERLATGANLDVNSPILICKNTLINISASQVGSGNVGQKQKAIVLATCLNAHLQGKKMKTVKYRNLVFPFVPGELGNYNN
jgi:hypothetical protein